MNFKIKNLISIFLLLIVTLALGSGSSVVLAQDASLSVSTRRAELERQLSVLEAQIKQQEQILSTQRDKSVSLERDVAIVTAQITKAKLSIKARDLNIQKLSQEIGSKNSTIGQLDAKLSREKESLAQLLRKTNEIDGFSLPEVILSSDNLSSFFEDVDSFASIKESLQVSFHEISDTKNQTTVEKNNLEEKRSEETSLRQIQDLEKRKLEVQEAAKQKILKESRGVEAVYQQILKTTALSAAQIRAELFTLQGSAAIPFEKAYNLAVVAGKRTGVRPALILGIIAEESNLGQNVGTGNWRVDMKAPRDTVPFVDITQRLGLDPDKMPVSKKPWYGYGGAMGPAQFIPSTWVLYEDRIAKATGHNPPNPWDPEDAFMASAILLMDNGADKQTYAAERLAALRYLAGWANASKKAYAFYGDDVMELAAKYQRQIDILQG